MNLKYITKYGDEMELINENGVTMVKHSDCNNEFEVIYRNGFFKYILSEEEKKVYWMFEMIKNQ